jgi:hypothetical protein
MNSLVFKVGWVTSFNHGGGRREQPHEEGSYDQSIIPEQISAVDFLAQLKTLPHSCPV